VLVYAARRLLALPVLLIGISAVTFLLLHLIPGNPAALYYGGQAVSGSTLAALDRQWGLDRPLPIQYLYYLWGLLHGDLGVSFRTGGPVVHQLLRRFPVTLELTLAGTLLAILIGIPIGIIAANRQGKAADHVIRAVTLVLLGVPSFWLGLVLLFLFNAQLHWLTGGDGQLSFGLHSPPRITGMLVLDALLSGRMGTFWNALHHLIGPAITVALGLIATVVRMLRSSLLEVSGQDYLRTARAKGLPQRSVLYKHALRNALIPTLTVVGVQFGYLLGGNVLVESVFAWPGLGLYLIQSVQNLDYPAVLGATLLFALLFAVVNLITDLLFAAIDPRIRYA
jgi:peptide/nickel transport system permease protein